MTFPPAVNDVDSNRQVVAALARLLNWHSVVSPDCEAGSSNRKRAKSEGEPCVRVTVWPAIVSVPVRLAPELAGTVNVTVPSPDPLVPEVIVMNEALLVAVHVQPGLAPIVIEAVPPAAFTAAFVLERL